MVKLLNMNKLYAFYDYLNIQNTISYLSYLLGEAVTELDISYLVWAGHLKSYRDDFATLQSVTVENNKIVSFDDYQLSFRTSIFPNVKYAVPYDHEKGTQYAYLIKDTKGKTYTAIDIAGQVIRPYMELRLKEDIIFSVQDLITLADTANKTANSKNIPKPTPPEEIAFQCFNEQANKHEDLYLINLHQQDTPTPSYEEELANEVGISKNAILAVTGILLERLLNKKKAYKNNNINQATIVKDIISKYQSVRSLSKRNIDQILADANTLLKTTEKENLIESED